MKTQKERKITYLKKQLKKKYTEYLNIFYKYDCGFHLTSYISPNIVSLENEIKVLHYELVQLDPKCPNITFK